LVDFQTPPPAVPRYRVLPLSFATPVMAETRPLIVPGPNALASIILNIDEFTAFCAKATAETHNKGAMKNSFFILKLVCDGIH
jgi:hypothetical protein